MNDDRVITLEDLSSGWDAYTGITTPKTAAKHHSQTCYNLQGQRVTCPGKGLYIIDGKKVIKQ
jgi:hypothetical protein